jgi:hypothetical protein
VPLSGCCCLRSCCALGYLLFFSSSLYTAARKNSITNTHPPPTRQTHLPNAAANNKPLFDDALNETVAAVGGKPVWITETGFPVSGHTSHDAVPSAENAKKFWDTVGCPLFGKMNVWWFILRDAGKGTPEPSFGIVGPDLGKGPLFDISCPGVEAEEEGEEEEEGWCDAD